MKKIVYVTGTRADYGLMKSLLFNIKNHPDLDLSLIVTGMHLSEDFGYTIKDIEKDGFRIDSRIDILSEDSITASMGKAITEISKVLKNIKPDIVLLEGDRYETFAAAIASFLMNIPIAHVSGGDVSGSIDDSMRHAITKLSNIHFPATKKSAERIIRLGEDPSKVYIVGNPGINENIKKNLIKPKEVAKKFSLDLKKPILLVIQHPVVTELGQSGFQMQQTINALLKLKEQTIIIYPNVDPGHEQIIDLIKRYEGYPFIQTYKSLPYELFLSLLAISNVIIGNSSCALSEAPSFHVPAVNIGTRQQFRERGENVNDVDYNENEILKAIKRALSKDFKDKIKNCKNPYLLSDTEKRIVDVLANIKLDKSLLQKRLRY